MRWQHPRRGIVPPVEFIPQAEATGLIIPIGHWVLETACAQLVAWEALPKMSHLTVAVNVSARQFRHGDFVGQVLAIIDSTGVNPQKLKLELTESLLLDDVEDIISKMTVLKGQRRRLLAGRLWHGLLSAVLSETLACSTNSRLTNPSSGMY